MATGGIFILRKMALGYNAIEAICLHISWVKKIINFWKYANMYSAPSRRRCLVSAPVEGTYT